MNRQNALPAPPPPPAIKVNTGAKIPQLRTLNKIETLDTLTQWKTTVRNFYRRDDQYKFFLLRTTVWNPTVDNYGFQAETVGLQRAAPEIKEDLEVFLNLISGFLPFSFLRERLEKNTTSMKDVWNLIFEVY